MFNKGFFKTLLFKSIVFIFSLCLVTIIYSLLIYYNIITNYYNQIGFTLSVVLFIFLGFISGLMSKKHHLLEAFISSLVVICVSLLLNFIFKFSIDKYNTIKIIIFVIAALLGSIISIKPKEQKLKK